MVNIKKIDDRLFVGWNEWCQLPKLKIPAIKAKIDTGAKTSAIHAFNIKPYHRQGKSFVQFDIHPIQRNDSVIVNCRAVVIDHRKVMSSTGHQEHRYVILTPITLGELSWEIELTLSNREPLKHRMLLGREALVGQVLIDPSERLIQQRISKRQLAKLYGCRFQDI